MVKPQSTQRSQRTHKDVSRTIIGSIRLADLCVTVSQPRSARSTVGRAVRARFTRLRTGARAGSRMGARACVGLWPGGPVGPRSRISREGAKPRSSDERWTIFPRAPGPRRWRRFSTKAIRGDCRRLPGGPSCRASARARWARRKDGGKHAEA